MNQKSPGVYVQEVSVFPPSVAEVATAIPAFVGYTQKAEFKGKKLSGQAVQVKSLAEYLERFGGAPAVEIKKVILDEFNNVTDVETEDNFYLYDSLQMYFANGGGRCYVVSVGTYAEGMTKAAITGGLDIIAKEDEPTLLLTPDAPLLGSADLYEIHVHALKQAGKLMDRFVIMDVAEDTDDFGADMLAFRNAIGVNNLKYGAAYAPYLKASLPKNARFAQIAGKLQKFNTPIELIGLTDEQEVKDTINALKGAIADETALLAAITAAAGASDSIAARFQEKLADLKAKAAAVDAAGARSALKAMVVTCYEVLDKAFDDLSQASLTGTGPDSLKTYLQNRITNQLAATATRLNGYVHDVKQYVGGTPTNEWYHGYDTSVDAAQWGTAFTAIAAAGQDVIFPIAPGGVSNDADRIKNMLAFGSVIGDMFALLQGAASDMVSAVTTLQTKKEESLGEQLPVYKKILAAVSDDLTVIPPSGAMAGIYCNVDATRGVWKAPANVSVSSVRGLTVQIDNDLQDGMNVDVNAGKSINAIRAFAGQGTLVWGARTLAGNDNEWRYVPVRRFFNMVEESIKKSTNWAVFEPNDANLWIKVKSMIENYLTLKWRDGALAGAAPSDAFYVNVGLGTTMTAQDILEGRLIIDIGMAAVRPAEFITLRFMHKMQES